MHTTQRLSEIEHVLNSVLTAEKLKESVEAIETKVLNLEQKLIDIL